MDYVLILGDLISHDDWELSEDLKAENNQFVLDSLRKTFWGNKDYYSRDGKGPAILPVVGNHEGHPVDFDDFDNPDGFLKKKILGAYEPLIGKERVAKVATDGFYVYRDLQRNLKFISINSNVNSLYNSHAVLHPENPMNILNKLSHSLYESEKIGEKVILLTHIPFADNSSQTVFARFVKALFTRFKDIISCTLAAHTHNDQMKFYKDETGQNTMIEFISPSLTTFSNRNPSYRIYKFSNSGEFMDYTQYRFNIDVMNVHALQGNLKFTFDRVYSLVEEYDIQSSDFWSKCWSSNP